MNRRSLYGISSLILSLFFGDERDDRVLKSLTNELGIIIMKQQKQFRNPSILLRVPVLSATNTASYCKGIKFVLKKRNLPVIMSRKSITVVKQYSAPEHEDSFSYDQILRRVVLRHFFVRHFHNDRREIYCKTKKNINDLHTNHNAIINTVGVDEAGLLPDSQHNVSVSSSLFIFLFHVFFFVPIRVNLNNLNFLNIFIFMLYF